MFTRSLLATWLSILTMLLLSSARGSFLDGDLDLADGVKLISVPVSNELEEEAGRAFGDSPLFRMAKFLQGHELHVKLPSLIEKDRIKKIVADSLKAYDEGSKDNAVTGRKKGDGGGGIALLGLMFAKTLGAIGIGGLGLLTLKALMVSALALMLSAIVGIKKLASSDHDDHGGHQVYHVEAGHHHEHRRRRDASAAPLPYRGWNEYNPYRGDASSHAYESRGDTN